MGLIDDHQKSRKRKTEDNQKSFTIKRKRKAEISDLNYPQNEKQGPTKEIGVQTDFIDGKCKSFIKQVLFDIFLANKFIQLHCK